MWNDVEAKIDLLNFSHIAKAAAQLIQDAAGEPLTIGVSGNWGTGKSSLVKMIGSELKAKVGADANKYIFLEFNAWLYQGYDDARQALLDAVGDKLVAEAESRKTALDKACAFVKRIKLLRVGRMLAPVGAQALVGGTICGPIGALVGAVSGMLQASAIVEEDINKVKSAYAQLQPELAGLLKEKSEQSLPKEIEALRESFKELLKALDVTLVVLVDDLDRCLPDTAIDTLEAMRLLLHVERTAFIIAADEGMIRSAVRAHFRDAEISNDLVTSYFDKLIQVPLQVPRLGTTEVKAYLVLLLADLARRRGVITEDTMKEAQEKVLKLAQSGWSGLSAKDIRAAFGTEASKLAKQIDLADQLAPILASAEQIAGNPRLIKRFLNNLLIREAIAKSQQMSIGFEELVKLQLFERCANAAGFEHLAKAVAASEDGKVQFLADLEAVARKGEVWVAPPPWSQPFYEQWVKISPPLGEVDLRPLMHLSRDRKLAIAAYDELSQDAQKILEALLAANSTIPALGDSIKALGEGEAERVLNRLARKARTEQFTTDSLARCLNITKAFPSLGSQFVLLLADIPANRRPVALVPLLQNESWAVGELQRWSTDHDSPANVKRAITATKGKT
ncbi:MAG: KAP family NTPase [Georgfuchsia sp.]